MRTCLIILLLIAVGAGSARALSLADQARKLAEASQQRTSEDQTPPADQPEQTQAPQPPADTDEVSTTQPFNFKGLDDSIQRLFEREAENYLRIGNEIWSIELYLRAQRFAHSPADKREPYQTHDAPLFYKPAGGKRARQLSEVSNDLNDVELLTGTVVIVGSNGIVMQLSGGLVMVESIPADYNPQKGQPLMILAKPAGTFDYKLGHEPKVGPRLAALPPEKVRPVTPAELAQHFAIHKIDRFHRWQARKIWDRQPKAKVVYQGSANVNEEQRTRSGTLVGSGQANPVEVTTDRGEYHWQWTPTGLRVPPLVMGFTEAQDEQ